MSRIIIQMEGGLVQDVFIQGIGKPTQAVIVDYDFEGADDDEITEARDTDGGLLEACIHTEKLNTLPKKCEISALLKAYDAAQK